MDLATARDIAIVVLAVMNIIVLIIALVLLLVLVQVVRTQIAPLLNSVKRTANTVEGTTSYLSRTAVSPVVRAAGLAAAAARFAQVFMGRTGRKRGAK